MRSEKYPKIICTTLGYFSHYQPIKLAIDPRTQPIKLALDPGDSSWILFHVLDIFSFYLDEKFAQIYDKLSLYKQTVTII